MFYLYILYSVSSDRYYLGYTDCIERRLSKHNFSKRLTYTSKHRPWILKKSIELTSNRGLAMKIEIAVKKLKSRRILEKIISDINTVEELTQQVRVPICRD
ncbi:GIY-YIG nuclease family protein [Pedobacter aquatilis]|uniref:GIY-YIG nuclease family protein n=1 Tax=Pedobacter aquatilis TaxID=351343 RepID=UPI00292E2B6B|nr:GIY-YIG nuclease family protein [Pedobacter aquatilis]